MLIAEQTGTAQCASCQRVPTANSRLFILETPNHGCRFCIPYGNAWVCTRLLVEKMGAQDDSPRLSHPK